MLNESTVGMRLIGSDDFLIMRNNVTLSDPGPDCVWDGLGTHTCVDNNCGTEVPAAAWD